MTKYKSKFTGQQIDDGIEYGVRVTQQTFSSAQKQQARENIGVTPEVQVGGNTPASDSGVKLFVDEDSDDTVEVYTKAQTNGQFVAVVNMNTEPTESTLTYTSTDGTTKNFKVGDEVRVPDAEADNGYTFYKLYALTTESNVTTAVWDKLGAAVDTKETVRISLTTNQDSSYDSDLIGATIVVKNEDTEETILSTTWDGSDVSVQIPQVTRYSIEVGNITGYTTPNSLEFIAVAGYTRNVSLTYNTELVSVICNTYNNASAVAGRTITVNDSDYTSTSSPTLVKVPYGTDYTVSVDVYTGYAKPAAKAFTASQVSRSVIMTYNQLGVFIEATDGTLYTSSNWSSSGKTANSVVMFLENYSRRIALTGQALKKIHSTANAPLENYLTPISTTDQAAADFDGKGNTEKIIQFNIAYGTNNSDYAAPYCAAFTFPAGQKGHFPSGGEMIACINNRTAISACLTACGGTALILQNDSWYRTSTMGVTEGTNRTTVRVSLYNGNTLWHAGGADLDRQTTVAYYVRPFSNYE